MVTGVGVTALGALAVLALTSAVPIAEGGSMRAPARLKGQITEVRKDGTAFIVKIEQVEQGPLALRQRRRVLVEMTPTTMIYWFGNDNVRVGGTVWVSGYVRTLARRPLRIVAEDIQLENGTLSETF